MALTLNCQGRLIPSLMNFGDCLSYQHHFFDSKPIPAHDVAASASSLNVTFYVG
jgi:hypothetical protein